jgi:hypothetical protein
MNGKIQNSPIQIQNSQIRPQKTLQPHHIRHFISGTLVFFLGIGANEGLMYLRRHWPKKVRWATTEIQNDYSIPAGLPPTNVQVDVGISEDGALVWRPRKDKD